MIGYIILMIVALIGMIVCAKKQDSFAAAKPLSLVLLLVVAVSGIMVLREQFRNPGDVLRDNESKFYASQAYVIGDYIKNKLGGGKILVITDSDCAPGSAQRKFVDTLKNASGSEAVIGRPDVAGSEGGIPIAEMMNAKDFDAVIANNADVKAVVSLIGLPRDLRNLKAIQNCASGKGPALILQMPERLNMDLINKGMITALVTIRTGAKFNEEAAPSDPKAAFDLRYILIDKQNVAENKALFN